MNIWIVFFILLLIGLLVPTMMTSTLPEGFIAGDGGQFTLGYGNLPYNHFPADKKLMRSYWGPYLWGWRNRPFYEYGPNTRAPYPYQFECNDYANQMCHRSCDPYCYKKNYLRCSAGVALVNPEPVCQEPSCPGGMTPPNPLIDKKRILRKLGLPRCEKDRLSMLPNSA